MGKFIDITSSRKIFLIVLIISALILVCMSMARNHRASYQYPERPEGVVFDQEKLHFVFTKEWLDSNATTEELLNNALPRKTSTKAP